MKIPPNIIIPHNLQPGKPCNSIEDELTRIYFMLNPGFNKKERTHSCENINAKDSQTYSYMKICLFRYENIVVVFCVLFCFLFFIGAYGKDGQLWHFSKIKGGLKSGQLGDNKFREPKVVHLYLNGLLFCLN